MMASGFMVVATGDSWFVTRALISLRSVLFPPGVAEGELHAGVDAGVAVSEGGAGDVDAVGAEVDGAARADEVVDADAALGVKFQTLASALGPSFCEL